MIQKPSAFWKPGPEAANLPVVLFPDGTKLLEGVPADVAQKVGLRTRAQTSFYDLAIVGGGRPVWPLPFMEPPKVCIP